jgi:hypothetical protein
MQVVVVPGQRFHRPDRAPVDLHREHEAGAHRLAVDLHRARAADPVLAADVRAPHAEVVAQAVRQ